MVSSMLYLIEILHQTTTLRDEWFGVPSCILSKFYIKPQPRCRSAWLVDCCILSKFYIKPQRDILIKGCFAVVSYRNSTSNHNSCNAGSAAIGLYLIEILHQTTTERHRKWRAAKLYLIEILHQTTTYGVLLDIVHQLYLIEILHQTTTGNLDDQRPERCILSKFYIKPQPCLRS